jgi:carbonic anhydrase
MKHINKLIEGSQKFQHKEFKKHQREFEKLAIEGQSPKVLFIGCCDSRVLPNLITNTGPGDLFIIRNIGNFVAPYKPDEDFHSTAAAIEYAVSVLEVEDIIVCGHSHCGAIAALYYEDKKLAQEELIHVRAWLGLGKGAKELVEKLAPDATKEDKLTMTEEISVLFQLENLLTYPAVKKRVAEGKLFLNGWHYDIEHGEIFAYDEECKEFKPLIYER